LLLLLVLLLHRSFLLLSLVSLLLHGLLLLVLLLLDLGDGLLLLDLRGGLLVVVIVAAAHEGQAGGANAGAGRRSQQRTPRHAAAAHPLPIVSLAHVILLGGTVPLVNARPTRSLPGQFTASYNTQQPRTCAIQATVHQLVQSLPSLRRRRSRSTPRATLVAAAQWVLGG